MENYLKPFAEDNLLMTLRVSVNHANNQFQQVEGIVRLLPFHPIEQFFQPCQFMNKILVTIHGPTEE